jgi:hypothetical protein
VVKTTVKDIKKLIDLAFDTGIFDGGRSRVDTDQWVNDLINDKIIVVVDNDD